MAISSKGFIDILTFAVSTPVLSAFTLILTLKSITRLTATSSFIRLRPIGQQSAMLRRSIGIVHVRNPKAASLHVTGETPPGLPGVTARRGRPDR